MATSYFTINEIADILRVSPPTVRKLIAEGKLVAVRVGGQSRISVEDFNQFLLRGRSETKTVNGASA